MPAPFSPLTRRTFLAAAGTTLIAAGGPAITDEKYLQHAYSEGPDGLDTPPLPPGQRVGIAVVGIGQLALGQILPAFAASKNVRLAGLVSGHLDKARILSEDYGIDPKSVYTYDSFDSIKENPDIQAVYIALPNGLHKDFTIRAAEAGKHVLCEKPMANTPEDCQAMIDACARARVRLMIAYRIHYEPHNRRARDLVQQGRIKAPKIFSASLCQNMGDPRQWRLDRDMAGGGVLMDLGIYALNGARFLLGEEPVEVSATTYSTPGDPRFTQVEEMCNFILRFPSGAQAVCASAYSAHGTKAYSVSGETGELILDPAIPYKGIRLRLALALEETIFDLGNQDQFALEMDHFGTSIARGDPPDTPGEEGLKDVKIMMKIYEAAQSGQSVTLR